MPIVLDAWKRTVSIEFRARIFFFIQNRISSLTRSMFWGICTIVACIAIYFYQPYTFGQCVRSTISFYSGLITKLLQLCVVYRWTIFYMTCHFAQINILEQIEIGSESRCAVVFYNGHWNQQHTHTHTNFGDSTRHINYDLAAGHAFQSNKLICLPFG